jgi:CheY-like chemotaxis protein
MSRILVIDDEAGVRSVIRHMLEYSGYEVEEAVNGDDGIALYRRQPADVVILDLYMPARDGLETAALLRDEFPGVKILAISGGGQAEFTGALRVAESLGAVRSLAKPFTEEELLSTVRSVLDVEG